MNWNAYRPRPVRDRARDGLPDPPSRVGAQLVSAAVLKLFDAANETEIALLDEVEKLQTTIAVLLGNGDDQAKVCFHELSLGLGRDLLPRLNSRIRGEKITQPRLSLL